MPAESVSEVPDSMPEGGAEKMGNTASEPTSEETKHNSEVEAYKKRLHLVDQELSSDLFACAFFKVRFVPDQLPVTETTDTERELQLAARTEIFEV